MHLKNHKSALSLPFPARLLPRRAWGEYLSVDPGFQAPPKGPEPLCGPLTWLKIIEGPKELSLWVKLINIYYLN